MTAEEDLFAILEALDATVWKGLGINHLMVEEWLSGFGAECAPGCDGRIQALYLLSRFTYFGQTEVRALAAALHRDCFRYPAVAEIRRANEHTLEQVRLQELFEQRLHETRFLGMGNPSESGTHLLYHYRQESELNSRLFISAHEMFDLTADEPRLADPTVRRYVFIDDFCGSGVQASRYSRSVLERLSKAAMAAGVDAIAEYHVLVGTAKGLREVRENTGFRSVRCVLELDETFQAFGTSSRYFEDVQAPLGREDARDLALRHGLELLPRNPLGFDEAELLLGFAHNTPNNTLPIFWHPGTAQKPWSAPFRRYGKNTRRIERVA